MWPILASIFSGLTGPIGEYFKTKAQISATEAQTKLEIKRAELTMATEVAKANVEQSKAQLAATSQSFKAFSYTFLTLPIIIVCVAPSIGKEIFENLGLIPVWYAQLYIAVVGVIWGLPIASSAVSGIFSAVQSAWDARNQRQIKKINAYGEASALNLDQAKKEIFDTMKKAVSLNGYTQAQVDIIGPVLDKVLSSQIQANPPGNTVINN
jgi:hypothetical protein